MYLARNVIFLPATHIVWDAGSNELRFDMIPRLIPALFIRDESLVIWDSNLVGWVVLSGFAHGIQVPSHFQIEL
jgi:hypothetical protein